MLCALSASTFAAAAAPRRRWLMALAAGFLTFAVFAGPQHVPDPEVAGLFASAGAVLYLFRPRHAWVAVGLGGALAAMLTQVLGVVGVPFLAAMPIVALLMAGVVWLARTRPAFSPESLREEALLIVCSLGLLVAVLPSVLDGWQAAANLNVPVDNVATQAIPVWALSVIATSTLLGAAFTLWSRR
jgi:hypothetical protein